MGCEAGGGKMNERNMDVASDGRLLIHFHSIDHRDDIHSFSFSLASSETGHRLFLSPPSPPQQPDRETFIPLGWWWGERNIGDPMSCLAVTFTTQQINS